MCNNDNTTSAHKCNAEDQDFTGSFPNTLVINRPAFGVLWTENQIISEMGISENTFREWRKQGLEPSYRGSTFRFHIDEIIEFLPNYTPEKKKRKKKE